MKMCFINLGPGMCRYRVEHNASTRGGGGVRAASTVTYEYHRGGGG